MKKKYRIKTNNQEPLIRKQNESDATSRWIEFQKTRPSRKKEIQNKERFVRRKPKDIRVIPDPIDDRKFQEWKESGKSGILLGITLNPRKCIGQKVRRIPINVETKW